MTRDATPARPRYRKVAHDDGDATTLYFIVCDEGWAELIVCERMYGYAADWLLGLLDRRPYAPEEALRRKGAVP